MITFLELSVKFLNWCAAHQEPRTHEWYANYVYHYLEHLGDKAKLPAMDMKPYQVEEWVDGQPTWGDNYSRGAVVAINRVYNWGERRGYVTHNPIKTTHKPPAQRRNIYLKAPDYDKILGLLPSNDPFRDLLIFVWTVGCRPQEVRHIEYRHLHLDGGYILFPKEESKGKKQPRKIILNDVAMDIIKKNIGDRTEGKVFLNTRGNPWTKYSICNRMYRLSQQTGTRMFMYGVRHSWATRKLKAGHGHLQIAACMGHTDGSMLSKVYSHIDEDNEHLRTVLQD